ncbi:MAG TPA: hypothetical protein PKX12_08005 [Spirochaetota bacterium]|nr:hypothetical protein [Spirochaetota bacterium]
MKPKTMIIITTLAVSMLFPGACTKKEMTPELFLQIEDAMSATDMTPESKARVTTQFGITPDQYQEFSERAKTDKKIMEQLGTLRLKQLREKETQ